MAADELLIRTAAVQPVCVLRLSGELSLRDVPRTLAELSQSLLAAPRRVVVCDVSELRASIRGSYLTLFPAALRRAGGWPRSVLHLAAPDSELDFALRIMRMTRYLPVHATLDAALDAAELDAASQRRQLSLVPDPASLQVARHAVRDMWPGPSTQGCQDAMVVMNELATNAIVHVARPFSVAMTVSPRRVMLAVTDPSRQEPFIRPRREAALHGRGMHVVDELSQDWGVRLVHPRGKTVWAALPAPSPAAPSPAATSPTLPQPLNRR